MFCDDGFDFGEPVIIDGNYVYKNNELTSLVFAHLLVALYNNSFFRRRDSVLCVIQYHKEHGGLVGQFDSDFLFNEAVLRLSGFVLNVSSGVWHLKHEGAENGSLYGSDEVLCDYVFVNSEKLHVDKEVGFGSGAVYVYYYDVYRKFAELSGDTSWPCKIGMTEHDVIDRILSQCGTAYPELPHVALVFHSDDPRMLEYVLHGILKLNGKHISDAPGKEWFITNPDEIEFLCTNIITQRRAGA